MGRQNIGFVKTGNVSFGIKSKGIGVHPFGGDIVFLHDGVDKFLETTGDHINIFRILMEKFLVRLDGFGNFLTEFLYQIL